VHVLDHEIRPGHEVATQAHAEPPVDRHLRPRAEPEAAPVVVVRDGPGPAVDRAREPGGAEGDVPLLPVLEAEQEVDVTARRGIGHRPVEHASTHVGVDIEEVAVVDGRAREPGPLAGRREVLVDEHPVADDAAADARQRDEPVPHEVHVDLGDDGIDAAPA
jgi:hypothetical protein